MDELLRTTYIEKAVSINDVEKVMNLKSANNQIMGGLIFRIGMALMEETEDDLKRGSLITVCYGDVDHQSPGQFTPELVVSFPRNQVVWFIRIPNPFRSSA